MEIIQNGLLQGFEKNNINCCAKDFPKEILMKKFLKVVVDFGPGIELILPLDRLAYIFHRVFDERCLLMSLHKVIEFDEGLLSHSINVAFLSLMLGSYFYMLDSELTDLFIGALCHDIGKLYISKEILNKKEELSHEEFEVIKTHCKLGYHYFESDDLISDASRMIILDHHERYDGQGYPRGLRTDEISLMTRIVSIADNYDALTSERTYRQALSPADAAKIMNLSRNKFDPEVLEIFFRKLIPFCFL